MSKMIKIIPSIREIEKNYCKAIIPLICSRCRKESWGKYRCQYCGVRWNNEELKIRNLIKKQILKDEK